MAMLTISWKNRAKSANCICVYVDKDGEPSSAEPHALLETQVEEYQLDKSEFTSGAGYTVSIVPAIVHNGEVILRDDNAEIINFVGGEA